MINGLHDKWHTVNGLLINAKPDMVFTMNEKTGIIWKFGSFYDKKEISHVLNNFIIVYRGIVTFLS